MKNLKGYVEKIECESIEEAKKEEQEQRDRGRSVTRLGTDVYVQHD